MTICSPYMDPTNEMIMIKVLTVFTIVVQNISVISIVVTYVLLVIDLKDSQEALKGKVGKERSNVPLLVQIVTVTSSNILCWVSSGVIYVVSMLSDNFPIQYIFWTTAVVVPLNSIVNPIVFLVTTARKHLA